MQSLELYQQQRGLWNGRIQREPAAWSKERAQYLNLLRAGHIEDFVALISDSLPVLFSLFISEDGFLMPADDTEIPYPSLRDFCAFLPTTETFCPVFFELWQSGAFDRMIFQTYAAAVQLHDDEPSLLLHGSPLAAKGSRT